ncbi:hypothetical protein FH972_010764 [Carpinus fangiana]|uniref:Uncharacterized protein n=1 Tax=Carpinus fangiana TaxID=176857 RepID=A0A660KP81_9ROSI|nr:hypothetical protein FH972_010764 [Carpinus fangiana]
MYPCCWIKGLKVKSAACSTHVYISLNACELDKFLRSIGRDSSYVELEANPPVGKDNPTDLAALVPSDSIVLPDSTKKAASLQGPTKDCVVSDNKTTEITGFYLHAMDGKPRSVGKWSFLSCFPWHSFYFVFYFIIENEAIL